MLPQLAVAALDKTGAKQQRDALQFYAELGAAKDPELSFPAPTEVPRISSRPANPVAEWMANGRVHNIRFNSSFEAVNPAMRDRCGRMRATTWSMPSIGATTTGPTPLCA